VRTATYRQAKAQFDAIVNEIRRTQDADNFLNTSMDADTLLGIVEKRGANTALVYLGATSWGGFALAVLSHTPDQGKESRFAALHLPLLTNALVTDLIESRIEIRGTSVIVGGFSWAQEHNGFSLLHSSSAHPTFRQLAASLQATCAKVQKTSMLDKAVHEVLHLTEFAESIDRPFTQLSLTERQRFIHTISHLFLQYELQRSLQTLTETALRPLATWLQNEGVTGMTLIPCGLLSAFPLAAVEVAPQKMLGDLFVTSVAPGAQLFQRSILQSPAGPAREGIYALGNPEWRTAPLAWGETEAYALAKLARDFKQRGEARVQDRATRSELMKALNKGYIVDLSCHGAFHVDNFLQSTLKLARGGKLTLGQILSRDVDLRGLRLLILSACQTAILDLRGASDEVHSLAAGMLQAGAAAVLASLWPVDDKATCLLMVRFAQEWFPTMDHEPPAAALARAQHWLRTVTNHELRQWEVTTDLSRPAREDNEEKRPEKVLVQTGRAASIGANTRGKYRYDIGEAIKRIHDDARGHEPDFCPYADPLFWAGFQIIGW
jgi:CHAT domain-containing protein